MTDRKRDQQHTFDSQRLDWDELAEADPLWAILTERNHKGGRWDAAAFMARGEQEVARLMDTLETVDRPRRRHAALDFGCGVGRLSLALAQRFDQVVGVDISKSMTQLARQYATSFRNVEFIVSASEKLPEFQDATFDLVYSSLVLQHLPTADLVKTTLGEFVRLLTVDGIAVFQLPARVAARKRIQLRRRLYRAMRHVGIGSRALIKHGINPMRLTAVETHAVTACVAAAGGSVIRVDKDESAPDAVESWRYFVIRVT